MNGYSKSVKIIGLILSGSLLLASAVASGVSYRYQAINESKEYTDKKIDILEARIYESNKETQSKLDELSYKTTRIHTIIEERFGKQFDRRN